MLRSRRFTALTVAALIPAIFRVLDFTNAENVQDDRPASANGNESPSPGPRAVKPVDAGQTDPELSRDEERERKAVERFVSLLEKSPRRGTALDRVYGYHVERGTIDAFLKSYDDRIKNNPNDGIAWLIKGLIEAQRGRDAASVSALVEAEKARPNDPIPPYYLGQALVLVGRPEDAAKAFERAIDRKPARNDLIEIFQALGRVYEKTNQDDRARAVWKRLDTLFPDDDRLQERIAAILAEESRPERALERYEALAKRVKDKFRRIQIEIEAAELKMKLGKSTAALADFEKLLGNVNPDSWLYREIRSKVEDVFLKNDDVAGLVSYYESWIKKNPEDVDALARLGKTLASQGRSAEAKAWFDKAVKLAPSRRELRRSLIDQLIQDKKYQDAAAQYESLAKDEPNNPDVIRDWGRTLLSDTARPEADRKAAARNVWLKLMKIRPKDPVLTSQAADLFRSAEMTDDAIALYLQAIEFAPDAPQYREYLGEYYHSLKKTDEALKTWNAIAAGPNRNAKYLGRLGEVLAGFGFNQDAEKALAEACALEPKDLELRIKHADVLFALDRFNEVDRVLAKAAELALDDDQAETVFQKRVRNDQASNKTTERIAASRANIQALTGVKGSKERVKLARYLEVERDIPAATIEARRATELDPRSVLAWATAARLYETSGDLKSAVDADRRLSEIDRRSRTEYLMNIAKLEARLGNRALALKAGRELLAAAPGNSENYEFYSSLCFQLGEPDEGLETLRRAARVNPNDTKTLLTLAETLAGQFRTDEAIEFYWKAFESVNVLDEKTRIVGKLAETYLALDRFDALIARLERRGNERDSKRENAILLAQAYTTSADFGAARTALEGAIASSKLDVAILAQLSRLAEAEGDYAAAAGYEKELVQIAPDERAIARLAELYVGARDFSSATDVWGKEAETNQDPGRILLALDFLLSNHKPEVVLPIANRLLRKNPRDWEALYREGTAYADLDRPDEAIRDFNAILDMNLKDDVKGRYWDVVKRSNSVLIPFRGGVSGSQKIQPCPLEEYAAQVSLIRRYAGIDPGGSLFAAFGPSNFGQARVLSIARLEAQARKKNQLRGFYDRMSERRGERRDDPRGLVDWYYLQLIDRSRNGLFEAARDLAAAAPTDPSAQWAYLNQLPLRGDFEASQRSSITKPRLVASAAPASAKAIERLFESFELLKSIKPEWIDSDILVNIAVELERANRTDLTKKFLDEVVAKADQPEEIIAAMSLAAELQSIDTLLSLWDRYERLVAGKALVYPPAMFVPAALVKGYVRSPVEPLCEAIDDLAFDKRHTAILPIVDHFIEVIRGRNDRIAGKARSRGFAPRSNGGIQYYDIIMNHTRTISSLDYPLPNAYFDFGSLNFLRNAFELFRRDDLVGDLIDHLNTRSRSERDAKTKTYALVAVAYLSWWNGEKDDAVDAFSRAAAFSPEDSGLKLALAEIKIKNKEFADAIEIVDSFEPIDVDSTRRRELAAIEAAVAIGNVDRARAAAERLFGLRLEVETQLTLARQMHQLGLRELAATVSARVRRRVGDRLDSLVALMLQYERQNKRDESIQVALQILGLTSRSNRLISNIGLYPDANARQAAIQVLARSPKLKEMIARIEAQIADNPNATALYNRLADYRRAAGEPKKSVEALLQYLAHRPDDAGARYQIAAKLAADGDLEAAIDQYTIAFDQDPKYFSTHLREIGGVFIDSKRFDRLADLLERTFRLVTDRSALDTRYLAVFVNKIVSESSTRDRGKAIFSRAWTLFPDARISFLRTVEDQTIWNDREMYDRLVQFIFPADDQSRIDDWFGCLMNDCWIDYTRDGRVVTTFGKLLESAAAGERYEDLKNRLESALKNHPNWIGGKALDAIVQLETDDFEHAIAAIRNLHKRLDAEGSIEKKMIPWTIAQRLETDDRARADAIAFYQTTLRCDHPVVLDASYGPIARLIALFQKSTDKLAARDYLIEYIKRFHSLNGGGYTPETLRMREIEILSLFGGALGDLGFPADGLRAYRSMLDLINSYVQPSPAFKTKEEYESIARRGIARNLELLERGANAKRTREMIQEALDRPAGDRRADAIELSLFVYPERVDRSKVESVLAIELEADATEDEGLPVDLKADLARLVDRYPDDFSVQTLAALGELIDGKADRIAAALDRLERLVERTPLEPLAEGVRPNARVRAAAERQVGLWLVARACLLTDSYAARGEKLADRSLAASRRLLDDSYAIAITRERGEFALKRGDRAAAEKWFGKTLEAILPKPAAAKR